jgi:hypothetical protein
MQKIVKIKDGEIKISVPFDEGAEVFVEISKVPKERSLRALRFYFAAIVGAICDSTGYHKEDVHEYLKMELNPKEFPDLKTGEVKTIGGSTRGMTSDEFALYTLKAKEIAEWVGAKIGTVDEYYESLRK